MDGTETERLYRELQEAKAALAQQATQLQEAQAEISAAREACPSVRMQDNFDASLLALVNLEVSRGFNRDAQIHKMRAQLEQSESQLASLRAELAKAKP